MSPIGLSHNSQSEIVAHVNSNNHHNNQYENHPLHPYFVLASIQHGQKKVGSALAPQKMLAFCSFPVSQQIDPSLEKEAVEVDEVRIEANKISPIFRPITVAATNLKLHNSIYEAGIAQIQHNQLPKFLVIGGDHSMAIGSITALSNLMVKVIEQKIPVSFSKSELIVFWIDAHADINTPSTTSSGNLHGCPVSLLTNMDQTGWNQLPSFDWRKEKLHSVGSGRSDFIQPSRICYIGLRAVDPEEQVTLDQHHILEYPMTKVKEYNRNMKTIVREALNRLDPDGLHPIHISLDIDGIDPFYAASTGTPVPDGLFPLECKEIINELQNTGRLVSMDLAEVNLELGTEEDVIKTRDTAAMLLDTFVSNL